MEFRERKMPWWLIIVTGVIIAVAGIYVWADQINGLKVLSYLVGVGALLFALFNFIVAFKSRDNNAVCIAHLVHGLLDLVLLLLLIVIPKTDILLGIILAFWMMIFGVFEISGGRKNNSSKRTRLGAILAIVGFALLIIPLVFSINYLVLIGIVGIVFGILRIALGILMKTNQKQTGSRLM